MHIVSHMEVCFSPHSQASVLPGTWNQMALQTEDCEDIPPPALTSRVFPQQGTDSRIRTTSPWCWGHLHLQKRTHPESQVICILCHHWFSWGLLKTKWETAGKTKAWKGSTVCTPGKGMSFSWGMDLSNSLKHNYKTLNSGRKNRFWVKGPLPHSLQPPLPTPQENGTSHLKSTLACCHSWTHFKKRKLK